MMRHTISPCCRRLTGLVVAGPSVCPYFVVMVYLRSFIFNSLFYLVTAALVLILLPFLVLPVILTHWMGRLWAWTTQILLRIAGVRHRTSGDPLINDQVIYAAKHQSAWETIALIGYLRAPVPVLKRSLLRLPVIGLFFLKSGCIPVDRSAGMKALKAMRKSAIAHRDNGRSLLIFPQGTRVTPGTDHPYEIGVFALYDATGLPVVPVALNSGHVWPRNSWRKYPGTVDVDFLEPIRPGLNRKEFMALLEDRIETRMAALDQQTAA